ncbi:MAG: TIGR03960 family B12-binding radical SAM protein [Syntrophales bacterium]|jgi:radical SAM family uncharacterized protein/radical SAM-linked protein|nr:TIGR03960 family B12-binding radical SAM protein [Syntrophales bacterium]MCK9527827.1 TIGR03960 family B12-binding radical SAM protein [Syntrophales bacterium]MDX9922076.1 TIGR03960 family B12-binding radical SAM protein [Syntrophales bacterium]
MTDHEIESILPLVQKPARYTGGETNAANTAGKTASLSFALAFPDVYEVGMSHQGLQILYGILNRRRDWTAERVYAPWPDMASLMASRRMALSSLESATPLHHFDIIGFSLQYELSLTNVLSMLDLGRVPLRAVNRREDHPLVIAGGPCVFNPASMEPFFDAFALGEGEEMVIDIAETVERGKKRGLPRRTVLEKLAGIEGLYVPSVHGTGHRIRKRVVADLDAAFLPEKPVVPLIKTIHDRITLEIARGCTRGCRFCQAGMVWRPLRERNLETIIGSAERILSATGYDEISLLALSAGDYSRIAPLLTELMDRNIEQRVALALPSLRTETLADSLIEQIRRVRKTSFTLAPEAGTRRLRQVINKGNSEENLLETARSVFRAGWKSLKLYFMIGLPTEQLEDLQGIAELVNKVLRVEGKGHQVTVGLSTFVPKPHTPFQWERQISIRETEERQEYFKDILRRGNLKLKWHDRRMSFLEGIIARGDGRVADVIEGAYRLGARFDGWSDRFRFELWDRALKDTGIDPELYLAGTDPASALPWDHIDCGVEKEFLLRELEKSRTGEATEDCRTAGCTNCGVCVEGIELRMALEDPLPSRDHGTPKTPREEVWRHRHLRMRYRKGDKARFLSHLDTASALIRSIKRSGIRFEYSRGFHPHPKISFPCATPLGVESEDEYAEIRVFTPPHWNRGRLMEGINRSLPAGLTLLALEDITGSDQTLSGLIAGFVYEMHLDGERTGLKKSAVLRAIGRFLNADRHVIVRSSGQRTRERDIRPFVQTLVYDDETGTLRGIFSFTPQGGVKPIEILTHVIGLSDSQARLVRVVKKQTVLIGG